ncbi:MAG TPA: signal recognition particle-docking protein FtsY [Candidatus Diapherotrites archaeon]|nr:signal recognition particle-docking protein FtsY [Candidatus Diapherotrites archaeon]
MFDLLKNKFKSFTDKLFGKAKEKAEEEQVVETKQETALPQEPQTPTPEVAESKYVQELTKEADKLEKATDSQTTEDALILGQPEVKVPEPVLEEPEVKPEVKQPVLEKPEVKVSEPEVKHPAPEVPKKDKHSIFDIFKPKPKVKPTEEEIPQTTSVEPEPVVSEIEQPTPKPLSTEPQEDLTVKKTTEIKKSFITSVKSIFTSKITLSEKEISDFLEEFELSLLEADVSIVSAENICKDLKEKLISASFSKDNPLEDIKQHIRESLKTQLDIDCDINNYIEKTRKPDLPFVIMFIGPNGAGKTTTISKFAYHYKKENKSVVLASGDTFRAGSIDQLEKHANAIGVKIIKQNYGSDPAAVAFDAVTSAKAGKIDYVFIDTAGRQENNINLMQELKKIKKVVSPNLTIYIGEAQAGQAIVDQVLGFDKEIGVDGVILTKIDTDPKGGVAISILNELKKPIFFVGTGQTYDDLEAFSPQFIIDRVVV